MTATGLRKSLWFWSFVLLMLGLTGLFAWLGVWQLQRLAEKEALIAAVDRQLAEQPYDLPAPDQWPLFAPGIFAYHPVTVSGTFENDDTVLVFTSLSRARGAYSGPGYWVMTPMRATTGGLVFINRGFIPQSAAPTFLSAPGPTGIQTVTGIAIAPESAGAFTPGPDKANRIEWVRNPTRLAALADIADPVFPLTIDVPAGEAGALPQGGETVIEFPNSHLGYAMTWFGFALITPLLLGVWVWRQRHPPAQA
jgi:surfeit locus 1 family protein